jgi:hypothetical protein
MKKLLEKIGITVDSREYHCIGKFSFIHSEHPNQKDIELAKKFVSSIIS